MLKSKTSRWLAGPYLLWMAIFTVVPLVIVVWYAMTNADGQFTLDNLTQIGRYSSVFARSLILAAISTVVCLVMAFPVGYFLSRLRANKQHIMLMLIMLPMWMNFLLRTYAWMTLLEKNGLINKFFGLFGLGPFNMINTSGAVVLGMVYNYLPFMILPIYTAMTKIDDSIVEAAQDLGCNVWQILFRVLVPLTGPGIATGITQVFVPAVSTISLAELMMLWARLPGSDTTHWAFAVPAPVRHRQTAISGIFSFCLILIHVGFSGTLVFYCPSFFSPSEASSIFTRM